MGFACGAGEGAGGSEETTRTPRAVWTCDGDEVGGWGGAGVTVTAPTLDGMVRCDDATGVRDCILRSVSVCDT